MRVAVTGIGLVTPIGAGRAAVWEAFLAGRCGIGPVRSFDTAAFPVHNGAEVHDFSPSGRAARGVGGRRLGRSSQIAVTAAELALADAGLDLESGPVDLDRVGVAMGTTSGEPREIEGLDDLWVAERPAELDPDFMRLYPPHVLSAHVAAAYGAGGPNITIPTACAAGNYAVAFGFDALRQGRADVMLVGGADSFSRITYSGFARLGAIDPDTCRPFDRDRQGMVPGEGGAVLVLEPLATAQERGARVYAEVLGYGLACDAHHMTASHPEGHGAARAMRQALDHAGLEPGDVSYISAHGTGTPTNDRMETLAAKTVFGDAARSIPMSSVKSMIGHTMGAASAIEAAVCALAIADDRVPPTLGLREADPECDLDYVAGTARELEVRVAMNNAYAFGGNNSSLLLGKPVADGADRRSGR
jgi:3-oxoacyl-[acyl-carrier-protein] synthase II